MMPDATFDGDTLRITLPTGERELDAGRDLYSAWKRWVVGSNRLGLPPAFRTVAGDPTKPGQVVEPYYFLRNDLGWRIRPSEENQETVITGNLYREDSALPRTVPTLGSFNAFLEFEVSPKATVVEKTIDTGSGMSTEQDDRLRELWQERGLDSGNPVTADKIAGTVTFDTITIDITGDGFNTSTATRQP